MDQKQLLIKVSEPDQRLDERKLELRNIFRLSEIISIEKGKPKELPLKLLNIKELQNQLINLEQIQEENF